MTKCNKYTLEYKCKAISFFMDQKEKDPLTSFTSISKKLNLNRRVFTRWFKMKEQIFDSKSKRQFCKLKNKSDKSVCPPMEKLLADWVNKLIGRDCCVDGESIRAKAIELYEQIHQLEFNSEMCKKAKIPFRASTGWLHNFCKSKSFSYRRITTIGRDLPRDTIERINNFYIEVGYILYT